MKDPRDIDLPNIVSVVEGPKAGETDDKFTLLDRMLEESGFFDVLEASRAESGKPASEFQIALKPNFMMAIRVEEPPLVYTDPELVAHWTRRLNEIGYSKIFVTEAQNVYNLWFHNRTVTNVARVIGMRDESYEIRDLTDEQFPFDYGEGTMLGDHQVGATWRDADFRISFAKNKTHDVSACTLCIKNTYGCLPVRDKYGEYHRKREIDVVTIEALVHFPVHFAVIDAIWSLDGPMGYREPFQLVDDKDGKPVKKGNIHFTNAIIGGRDLLAVERIGMIKMGLDPDEDTRFFKKAVEAFGERDFELIGSDATYPGWLKVGALTAAILDIGEELPVVAHFIGESMGHMDPAHFPRRHRTWFHMLSHRFASFFMMRKVRARKGEVTVGAQVHTHSESGDYPRSG